MREKSSVVVVLNGEPRSVAPGITVAAALANAGIWKYRRSSSGEPRGVFCAMGICFECRVTIDGTAQQRACTTLCRSGMDVRTDD